MRHRIILDCNRLIDEIERNSDVLADELVEPPKESLEEYLTRKRNERLLRNKTKKKPN